MTSLDDLPLRANLRGQIPYGAPQLHVPVALNVNENTHPIPPAVASDIAAALAEAILTVNGGMAAAEGTGGIGAAAFDYVTIEAGQSLWQLAESVAPAQDPRDVIADIVNLNQLTSEAVQPGQRLALPADY